MKFILSALLMISASSAFSADMKKALQVGELSPTPQCDCWSQGGPCTEDACKSSLTTNDGVVVQKTGTTVQGKGGKGSSARRD